MLVGKDNKKYLLELQNHLIKINASIRKSKKAVKKELLEGRRRNQRKQYKSKITKDKRSIMLIHQIH